ncbi:hypothetical protein ACPW96_10220 [Micromonospora sp. DT81.3]|uniref:dinucleotide-utilizing enzyme n=1 Tax=Actinomycetes TaxID=1760 RepID=UPI003CFBA4A8
MNTARPSLTRSIPFWALVVLSIAAVAYGAWFSLSQITAMTAALSGPAPTPADVYGPQSLVIVGAVVLGAGLVGILLALSIATLRALVPSEPLEVVDIEQVDAHAGPWDAAPTGDLVATPAPAPVASPSADTVDDAPPAPLTR